MDIEIIKTIAENGSTIFLLWLFVYFFLTKFTHTQEKIVDQMWEINKTLILMTDKIITSDSNQIKIVEHLWKIETRIDAIEKYQTIR